MRYGSVCSGIESASLAWEPLGWEAAWFAEVEPFPCAVLAHHWPNVPNLGDMTAIADKIREGAVEAPDVLVGGTPCQSFSVAGLRKGISDARGQLTMSYVDLANAIDSRRSVRGEQPCITVWENVPGVLSDRENAFGCFLGALAGEDGPIVPPGMRWTNAGCVFGPQRAIAWRIVDAQFFGVAQRRRRVFVVSSAREGFDPTSVLFESEGVRRDTPPSREAWEAPAGSVTARLGASGPGPDEARVGHLHPVAFGQNRQSGPVDVSHGLRAKGGSGHGDFESETFLVTFDTTQITHPANCSNPQPGGPSHPLAADAHAPAIAFPANLSGTQCASTEGLSPSMGAKNPTAVASGLSVRRLMPVECERLQGMPDGHTDVPYRKKQAADGPRYKAIGNSKAVPCVRWLGERIAAACKA